MDEVIFPIVTFNPDTKVWKCLGTGYFINPVGAFITAKHLLFLDGEQMEKTLYGIHNIDNKEYHVRPVTQLIPHKDADIMIGTLGERRLNQKDLPAMLSKHFVLDFEALKTADKISTYAYPNTISEVLDFPETEFTFTREFSKGEIVDYHPNGTLKVRNRCYQTTMEIKSGSSGGPVLRDGYIVGVNSSSFDLMEDEEPISFITPIDYVLDLSVKENRKLITVKELISNNYIKTKNKEEPN